MYIWGLVGLDVFLWELRGLVEDVPPAAEHAHELAGTMN